MVSSFFCFYFKVKRSILPICEDRSEYFEWFAFVGDLFFSPVSHLLRNALRSCPSLR